MKEQTLSMNELTEKVLDQLKDQNYMESTLTNYRRIYRRLHTFLIQHGRGAYSKELGKEFLKKVVMFPILRIQHIPVLSEGWMIV